MALVDYSESESSEGEGDESSKNAQIITPKSTQTTIHGKPAFQKVVDRSKPHKIKVSLPDTSPEGPTTDENGEPARKRPRLGSSLGGGFNSLLPAPKRSVATTTNGRGRGLGQGVNLKTAAAPAFSRDPMINETNREPNSTGEASWDINHEKPDHDDASEDPYENPPESVKISKYTEPEPKIVSSMMFKPLSVSKKPQKKNKAGGAVAYAPSSASAHSPSLQSDPMTVKTTAPKISLFSLGDHEEDVQANPGNEGYHPLIHGAASDELTDHADNQPNIETTEETYQSHDHTTPDGPSPDAYVDASGQSLDTIAADLNLSASAKRQLLGRSKATNGAMGASAINVLNFNTDREYAANDLLRQAGEKQQHNPVKAIAAGKHSLKQLINAAANQKEALEDQFASGRRNKKDFGSKYGW
ncbi:hypothetical protein MMC25_004262 [Agyrium rufum]|nr:hypothetical protein [Agyrium rufum]